MSCVQTFRDTGVLLGLLGRHDAPDHSGVLRQHKIHMERNLGLITDKYCPGSGCMLLTSAHEPNRIAGFSTSTALTKPLNSRAITTPACGIFLNKLEISQSNFRTIAMAVCDHATVGVQLFSQHGDVVGLAMVRVTIDRSYGEGSVIQALFDLLKGESSHYRQTIADIQFHLSAGRGACCFPKPTIRLRDELFVEEVGDADDDDDEVEDVIPQFDMLARIALEIKHRVSEWNRPIIMAGCKVPTLAYGIHHRDSACTVCCAGDGLSPYYTSDDVDEETGARIHNLAFFHSGISKLVPVWKKT